MGLHVRRADATHWSHVRTRGDGGGRAVDAVRAIRAKGRAGSPQSRHCSCDRRIVRRTGPQNLRVFVLIIECGVWLCFRKYIIYPNINDREIRQLPCALPPRLDQTGCAWIHSRVLLPAGATFRQSRPSPTHGRWPAATGVRRGARHISPNNT